MAYIKKTTPHGNTGKKQSPDTVAKRNEQIKKPIIAFDGQTEYHFDSVNEAADNLNIKASQISILLSGHAKGYSFKYGSKS
jgi:hypothetical protein